MASIKNPTVFFQNVRTFDAFRDNIDQMLFSHLPVEENLLHKQVIDAMRYSYEVGGKRIRPLLMYGAYRLFADSYLNNPIEEVITLKPPVEPGLVEAYMAAIEMIHTYSLIHDDLPAMDNDDLRRGKPTCHIQFGEANAILAGDGLLNYAFELVLSRGMTSAMTCGTDAKQVLEASYLLAKSSGVYGMIGGQAADMLFETNVMSSQEDLDYIHKHKTGAIITGSLCIGGLLGGASASMLSRLEQIGYMIGLSFQIQDDILDCTSTEAELGKPIGSDEKNNKKTYVTFKGLEQSKKDVTELLKTAREQVLALTKEIRDCCPDASVSDKTVETSETEQVLLLELVDFLSDRRY